MFSGKYVSFIYAIITLFSKIAYYLNFVENYVRLNWKKKVNVIMTMINMRECAQFSIISPWWAYINRILNALSPKCAKILNMAKFWIWQSSQYTSVSQRSKYGRICLDRILNICSVLSKPGLKIWQGLHKVSNMSDYHFIRPIMPEYALICLNVSQYAWT